MKALFKILPFVLFHHLAAQEWASVTDQYIQNPSFEEYAACPQSNSAYPSAMWIDSVVGWYAPTAGTSDYFNVCNTIANGIPYNNGAGYQPAFDGVGYCGFLAYANDVTMNNSMWSEYVQTKLIKPLKSNTTYIFSMRINRANDFNFAAQNIGANFSENANNDFSGTKPYDLIPTVLNTTGFLTDTLDWTLISGQFTATGDENYLTIGWFGDTVSSDFSWFIPPEIDPITGDSLFLTNTFYLVDSITLSELIFSFENFNINIITPNGDGSNDFLDFSIYELSQLSFSVYNRWGNNIFNSDDIKLKWNGENNNNKQLSDGVYYYIIDATLPTGKQIRKHNFIHVFY